MLTSVVIIINMHYYINLSINLSIINLIICDIFIIQYLCFLSLPHEVMTREIYKYLNRNNRNSMTMIDTTKREMLDCFMSMKSSLSS